MFSVHKHVVDENEDNDELATLLDYKKYVTMCDGSGMTTLHKCFIYDNTSAAEWILKNFPQALEERDLVRDFLNGIHNIYL